MIGVILAAGMAKRLRPLTDACPKCLLKIGDYHQLVDACSNHRINGALQQGALTNLQ